jgi:hypothetical protein
LFKEERLVVDQPIGEWRGAIRPKFVPNCFNRLKGTKEVYF